jgi:hypothetical protein
MPRISLRQLFMFVALVAVAIVSLRYASPLWQGVIGMATMLAFFAAVLAGIFDRGPRQVFAIALALVMLAYGLAASQGRPPTTLILRALHGAMAEYHGRDANTGQVIPDFDLAKWQADLAATGTTSIVVIPSPPEEEFMPIGHYWFALLFGYVGGKFARFVYLRRAGHSNAK